MLILAFVGFKMLTLHHAEIPITASLIVIAGILAAGIFASIVVPPPEADPLVSPVEGDRARLMRITLVTARRTVALVVGGTLILFGTVLKIVPGLGVVVITAGLSVLATQFVWARKLLSSRTE